jgi:hypothetical protein
MNLLIECSRTTPLASSVSSSEKIKLSESPLFVDKHSVSKKHLKEYFINNYGTDNPVPRTDSDNRVLKRSYNDLQGIQDDSYIPNFRKLKQEKAGPKF